MDYSHYVLSKKEKTDYYIISCISVWVAVYLFFGRWYFAFGACFLAIPAKRLYVAYKIDKRREKLSRDFRDALYSISGSVAAGRSVAESIKDGYIQLEMSGGAECDCCKELKNIYLSYQNSHAPLEDSIYDFALRSNQEEIGEFANAFRVCVAYGGDLESLCLKSCSLLIEKMELKAEARALLAEKKLDLAIITAMPFVILLFLNLSSSDYLDPLYYTTKGMFVMAISLALISLAVYWGIKLLNVKM